LVKEKESCALQKSLDMAIRNLSLHGSQESIVPMCMQKKKKGKMEKKNNIAELASRDLLFI